MTRLPLTPSPTEHRPSRRTALAGIAVAFSPLTAVACRAQTQPVAQSENQPESQPETLPPTPQAERKYPTPMNHDYQVIEVGPGQRYTSLTDAGVFINSRWTGGASPEQVARMGFRVLVHPGPAGYYTNDSGSHSRRWPDMRGWPAYEGNLIGPAIIEGAPGKPPPVLDTDGYGDGVLYYQTGLFSTGSCDATFKRLIFRGFRRRDGYGNYAAIRLGQTFGGIPMHGVVTLEDCEISGCDDGLLGGAPGQTVILRRCYIHDNGNESGLTHNIYIGAVDELLVEDVLSTRTTIGHLLKSRAARTTIRNSRLLGGGGTESACLDVPNGGMLDIAGLVCEKSQGTDAVWLIHYSGENQDDGGVPFHNPSSIRIQDLTMIAPDRLTRKSASQAIYGFANQSGDGAGASGRGSRLITPQVANVRVYNLSRERAGVPSQSLSVRPQLDMSSPVRL